MYLALGRMRDPLLYCSMAWPIQPTVLPRAKSATAPPGGNSSVRATVASEIYGGMLVHQTQHLSGNTVGERDGDTLRIGLGRQAKQPGTAGIAFRIQRVPE